MLPFAVTICGLHELPDHAEAGITHVLSILDPGWPVPDAFGAYGEHARLELRFDDVIEERPERVAPTEGHVAALLGFGRNGLAGPAAAARLLVHCHAGVSRSSAATALLLAQAEPERPAAELFAELLQIRPQIWPNSRMVEMGDALLGRGGELVAACRGVHRRQLERRPEYAVEMRMGGREREVTLAQAAG